MTAEIPADVIERCRRAPNARTDLSEKTVVAVLRAAGWPELVAERDRTASIVNQLAETVPGIDSPTEIAERQRALIADLAAGLREAREWVRDFKRGLGSFEYDEANQGRREFVTRIDALLAKADPSERNGS